MCDLTLDRTDPLVAARIVSDQARQAYRNARANTISARTAFEVARIVEVECLRAEILRVQSAPNPYRSVP